MKKLIICLMIVGMVIGFGGCNSKEIEQLKAENAELQSQLTECIETTKVNDEKLDQWTKQICSAVSGSCNETIVRGVLRVMSYTCR